MGWLVKDLPGEANLHKLSRSHYRNARRDLCNNRQAVRDKDVGKPELALQLLEQQQNLRAYGNIQRRNGFVGDHKFWPKDERPRNADPLPLPAGKFVRVAARRSGTATAHSSRRNEQRGSNAQPGGSAVNCGTEPGIGDSLPRSIVGEAFSKPCVYGWRGACADVNRLLLRPQIRAPTIVSYRAPWQPRRHTLWIGS